MLRPRLGTATSRSSELRRALLPPALRGWPAPLRRAFEASARPAPEAAAEREPTARLVAARARIRRETLYWPACSAAAARPRALALDRAGREAARTAFLDADILVTMDLKGVDPERLEAVYGRSGPETLWARLGGIAAPDERRDVDALLATADCVSPWTGEALTLDAALDAQAFLRERASAARGPIRLVGMSRWKRRNLAPFLTGPDGPPRRAARIPASGPFALWGSAAAAAPGAEDVERRALRVEDGFVRSVGLGLRHAPPISLVIAPGAPYFDATRPNAFDAAAAGAGLDAAALARARRLRARLLELRLTKYNLPEAPPPPTPPGREAVLVAGQVAGDASIRLGATGVRGDLDLLRAARGRFPDAFIVYKPHPDVLTGMRDGAAPLGEARRCANHIETRASALQCVEAVDRVVTITSLIGFEALLRGKPVTTFGRPFYAGWGLTDDVDPPRRGRALSLDALVAAALIAHASYIDPFTRLPAPPEIAIEALARQRAFAHTAMGRATQAWRNVASWTLNRL